MVSTFPNALEARSRALENTTVFNEVNGIGTAILTALGLNALEAYVNDGTTMTNDTITTFNACTVDTSTNVFTLSAHGFASGDRVQFYSTGTLYSPLVVNTYYWVTVLSSSTFKISSSYEDYSVGIFTDITGGTNVLSVTITVAGTGYTTTPSVTFTGGSGSLAAGTARLKLVAVSVSGAGTGYTPGSYVATLSGGTFTSAATINVTVGGGGTVTGVTIDDAGIYSIPPSTPAAATGITGGTGATFTVSFGVKDVVMTNGGVNYLTAPTVGFTGGGGASAAGTAVIGDLEVKQLNVAMLYYLVWQGLITDRKKYQEMQDVIEHYQALGYTITRLANPVTESQTFYWQLYW